MRRSRRRDSVPPSPSCCVARTDFGRARLADLAREGIDTSLVRRSGAASSGVALILVDAAGENNIVVVLRTKRARTAGKSSPISRSRRATCS
jgi:sugar/nucleoside kinase (ribokinase family)